MNDTEVTPGDEPPTEPDHADPVAVRHALRGVPMPVTVLLVHDGTELRGMTATSVMPVSLAPPLLAVAVGHARWAHDVLEDGTGCTVSLLAAGHEHLADHFGGSARREKGVQVVRFGSTPEGRPAIEDAIVTFGCVVDSRATAGDHSVILLRIVEVAEREFEDGDEPDPMLWHAGGPTYLDRG